jgi:BirA family biotin operon repressor/biotin-[acetyl-CoA-carboxylase] ligase
VPHSIPIAVLDEVDSTNRVALARAQAGETGPLWIMAARQTAGRGRAGRAWASERGNLYATLLLRLTCHPTAVPGLSLLSGVAVYDAIVAAAGRPVPGLRLKWPNDVLIGSTKCAGILAESLVGREAVTVAIGIGINLAWHPADLGREATHLAAHGVTSPPGAMLEFLSAAMERWLADWNNGAGFAAVRTAWLERTGAMGEACTVNTGTERIGGSFAGLDDTGSLLIADSTGTIRTVTFGDVTLDATSESSGR